MDAPENPYAPPSDAADDPGAARPSAPVNLSVRSDLIVSPSPVVFPDWCARCGADDATTDHEEKMGVFEPWQLPAYLIAFGIDIALDFYLVWILIGASLLRQTPKPLVVFRTCAPCTATTKRWHLPVGLLMCITIVGFVTAVVTGSDIGLWIFLVALVATVLVARRGVSPVRPVKHDHGLFYLAGASPSVLGRLRGAHRGTDPSDL